MKLPITILCILLFIPTCFAGETIIFQDSFDSYQLGSKIGGPWVTEGDGTVALDETRSKSGKYSVKFVSGESYANRAFLRFKGKNHFPLDGNKYFGSMYMFMDSVSPDGIHWTMIQSGGKVPGTSFMSEIRYGGQHSQRLMANYDTRGVKSDCWHHSKTVLPEKKWVRVEWMFDGNKNEAKFWLDGEAVGDLTVKGKGQGCLANDLNGAWKFPVFEDVTIGWVDYQTGGGKRTLWIDDFVISTERVG